jgi:hypothetical protein
MPNEIPKRRFWQSRKMTLQSAELGVDVLKMLAHAKQPRSLGELQKALNLSEVQRAIATNAVIALHRMGCIEGDRKVSRMRLVAETTRISITPAGYQLLKESRTRLEFARHLIENS